MKEGPSGSSPGLTSVTSVAKTVRQLQRAASRPWIDGRMRAPGPWNVSFLTSLRPSRHGFFSPFCSRTTPLSCDLFNFSFESQAPPPHFASIFVKPDRVGPMSSPRGGDPHFYHRPDHLAPRNS
ncbi:unnamed protein product [Caenorhabditis auriculariae]|uniref:Uncharacterized protein n=1 Tax=Caenorhabditis auriculariae TaxID=2777116 RepID=A0A8S1H5Q6_9PELO|nr:unnamed protein product [Caenorhabditis auriculariae]